MMTKEEIAKEYTLTDRGTVASPGKFEGEMWYVVALWDLILDGGCDLETGDENPVSWFRVDSNLTDTLVSETMTAADAGETVGAFVERYPVGSYFGLYEDSQGFVWVTSSETDPSVAEDFAESGYTDCGCRDCFDVAISSNVKVLALCSDCADAGCSADGGECQRADAYGASDDEGKV